MPPNDDLRAATEEALGRLKDFETPAEVPRGLADASDGTVGQAPRNAGRRNVRRIVATVIAAVAALGTIAEALRRLLELLP